MFINEGMMQLSTKLLLLVTEKPDSC